LQVTQGLTMHYGYRESEMVTVNVSRVAEDVYLLVPESDLATGEYMFMMGVADHDFGTRCTGPSNKRQ